MGQAVQAHHDPPAPVRTATNSVTARVDDHRRHDPRGARPQAPGNDDRQAGTDATSLRRGLVLLSGRGRCPRSRKSTWAGWLGQWRGGNRHRRPRWWRRWWGRLGSGRHVDRNRCGDARVVALRAGRERHRQRLACPHRQHGSRGRRVPERSGHRCLGVEPSEGERRAVLDRRGHLPFQRRNGLDDRQRRRPGGHVARAVGEHRTILRAGLGSRTHERVRRRRRSRYGVPRGSTVATNLPLHVRVGITARLCA